MKDGINARGTRSNCATVRTYDKIRPAISNPPRFEGKPNPWRDSNHRTQPQHAHLRRSPLRLDRTRRRESSVTVAKPSVHREPGPPGSGPCGRLERHRVTPTKRQRSIRFSCRTLAERCGRPAVSRLSGSVHADPQEFPGQVLVV